MSVAAETNVPGTFSRHLSIGAEIVPEGVVHSRVGRRTARMWE